MSQRFCHAIVLVLVLSLASGAWANLVGHWKLDEGSGTTARDSSGNGYDGTLQGGPQWVPGVIGGALKFSGTNSVNCGSAAKAALTQTVSIALWVNPADLTGDRAFAGRSAGGIGYAFKSYGTNLRFTTPAVRDHDGANSTLKLNTWQHVAVTFAASKTGGCVFYINGIVTNTLDSSAIPAGAANVEIGHNHWEQWAMGMIDDVRIYDHVLTQKEVQDAMKGTGREVASDPTPKDKATDVPIDAALAWTAGPFAGTHDVYLGTSFEDVNTATRAKADVLASQGQTDAQYAPKSPLKYGQTYYWRIDEVNKTPDNTIFKGSVWSFTAEPYGYPVKPVSATASSFQAGMGPEKTIDGSGLSGDLHGTEPTTMWMSAGAQPNWIQYEFDKVYKFNDLTVWNSNQLIESFLGFGAKTVKIEYSADGTTWTALANVPEFAKGPGMPAYAANTTVNFGGVEAKFVKLTITANWGGLAPQTGLAEVRFTYVPVQARSPQPATGTATVNIDAKLDWRPGREATSHKVLFGTDRLAVIGGTAPAKTVTSHGFDPGALNFGTSYYWRVDEVGTATYPGGIWSFTTQQYKPIDNFESYTDKAGEEIFTAWVDGFADNYKSSGSTVGLDTAVNGTFGETTIIHGGKQSMPMAYDNAKAPNYSEATRTFDTPQDCTGNGANTLSLWFKGFPAAYLETATGVTLSGGGADIYQGTVQCRYAYKQLTGDGSVTVRVDSAQTVANWSKSGVMMRAGLNPLDVHVHLISAAAQSLVEFMYRPTVNVAATTQFNTPANTNPLPVWLRLTRAGNVFTGEVSTDGKAWSKITVGTNVSTQTVAMPPTIYIGFVVDAGSTTGQLAVADFSQISTTGNVSAGSWQVADIGLAQPSNSPAGMYLVVEDKAGKKATIVNPNPNATATQPWTEWKIALSDLTGVNVAAVKKLTIGVGDRASPKASGTGRVYIDDIQFGGLPAPVGLVTAYSFENDLKDGSANGYDGTAVGTPTFTPGKTGSALKLNGTTDCVDLGNWPGFNFPASFSLSVWANIGAWTSNWNHVMVGNRGENGIGWQLRRRDSNKICFTTRGVGQDDLGSKMDAPLNEWVHITAVYDNAANTKRIYVNGVEDAFVATTPGKLAATTHNTYIGCRANSGNTGREGYFTGMLDEVKIYDIALTAGEVLKLAGK